MGGTFKWRFQHLNLSLSAETLFGHVPVLVLPDGEKKLSETCTIARYLANKHNLAPKDCFEDAQASMILEVLNDAYFKLPFFEKDEEEKVGIFLCKCRS